MQDLELLSETPSGVSFRSSSCIYYSKAAFGNQWSVLFEKNENTGICYNVYNIDKEK